MKCRREDVTPQRAARLFKEERAEDTYPALRAIPIGNMIALKNGGYLSHKGPRVWQVITWHPTAKDVKKETLVWAQ